MAGGTVRPGIFTAAGELVPVEGGPWLIGQPPIIRVGYAGELAAPRSTRRWTGTDWAVVRPS